MKLFRLFSRVVRGFTLIELLVSISIMIIMTTMLLSEYPGSAVRITLVNSTHTLALLLREAQVRGSAVDSVNTSVGGYGIYIARATPDKITLFADSVNGTGGTTSVYGLPVGDGLYQKTPIDETKKVTTLPRGYTISKICVGTGYPFTCNGYGSGSAITSLTISFTRPNPQPAIYINDSKATAYTGACIELVSPSAPKTGHVRSVEVYGSGMVRTTLSACDTK
jgi:prepilin-type N-terminal cleavage/methylation domain-containing protein